jgi:hypothetical protein
MAFQCLSLFSLLIAKFCVKRQSCSCRQTSSSDSPFSPTARILDLPCICSNIFFYPNHRPRASHWIRTHVFLASFSSYLSWRSCEYSLTAAYHERSTINCRNSCRPYGPHFHIQVWWIESDVVIHKFGTSISKPMLNTSVTRSLWATIINICIKQVCARTINSVYLRVAVRPRRRFNGSRLIGE